MNALFFETLIDERGDILATLKKLNISFDAYVAMRADPDFESKLGIVNELLASSSMAAARVDGVKNLQALELRSMQVGPKPVMRTTAQNGPMFTINFISDE